MNVCSHQRLDKLIGESELKQILVAVGAQEIEVGLDEQEGHIEALKRQEHCDKDGHQKALAAIERRVKGEEQSEHCKKHCT